MSIRDRRDAIRQAEDIVAHAERAEQMEEELDVLKDRSRLAGTYYRLLKEEKLPEELARKLVEDWHSTWLGGRALVQVFAAEADPPEWDDCFPGDLPPEG